MRRGILWEREGTESSVALDDTDGLAMVVNGKIDGNARGDAPTQVMGGLLGALLHPHPRSAMVIGLGTGSTAGWLGAVPSIERVDVAELEASMLHVAAACAPVNERVVDDPKVRVLLGDAREILLTVPSRYDVIFSEPSNPYRAGVAGLFTREYYRAVASRLEEGGVFLQWLQMYEIDEDTVRAVYATLGAVFPVVRPGAWATAIWCWSPRRARSCTTPTRSGPAPPRSLTGARSRRRGAARGSPASRAPRGAALRRAEASPLSGASTPTIRTTSSSPSRVTSATSRGSTPCSTRRATAAKIGRNTGGRVDWDEVEEERVMGLAGEGTEPDPAGLAGRCRAPRGRRRQLRRGQPSGRARQVAVPGAGTGGGPELDLVAEGLAEAGRDEAVAVIERCGRAADRGRRGARAAAAPQGKRDEAAAC